MKRKKVFFSTLNFSSFIRKDLAVLEKEYRVLPFHFHPLPKWLTPLSFLRQWVSLIWHFPSTSAYTSQFGGYHAFLPALFSKLSGKPCLIITAGTDCVAFPSLRYGNFQKTILGTFTKWSYLLCTHIAAVHKSLIFSQYTYQQDDYPQQGIWAFCKNIKTPMSEINYGYDSVFFNNRAETKRPLSFITVAAGASDTLRFKLKGIDLTVSAAQLFPDFSFTLVGVEKVPPVAIPANVKIFGMMSAEQLRELLSEHEFYLQLSISEGFPNALCEAMLCECIPIGSTVGAIPDIIGDTGFLLEHRDTAQLRELILKAVQSDKKKLSKAARQRIIDNFPIEKRERALLSLLASLLAKK